MIILMQYNIYLCSIHIKLLSTRICIKLCEIIPVCFQFLPKSADDIYCVLKIRKIFPGNPKDCQILNLHVSVYMTS